MHSLPIVGVTIALLFSLETCIVQIQSVRVDFVCTERLFNLDAEVIINDPNGRLCARRAIFFLKNKQFHFSCHLVKGCRFLKRDQSQFKMLLCYWRCVLSWRVLSQQREMRIYWWLCNNSEIHLWLWKVWSLVFCSQSSFHATRAREEDKNRIDKTRFFFAKKDVTRQTIVS